MKLWLWFIQALCPHAFVYETLLPAPAGFYIVQVRCELCGKTEISKPIKAVKTNGEGRAHDAN